MSIRQAAREFGLARKTIRKMLQHSLPPGYARTKPVERPMLGPWLGIIDQILVEDRVTAEKAAPHGQAHLRSAEGRARLWRWLYDPFTWWMAGSYPFRRITIRGRSSKGSSSSCLHASRSAYR